MKKFLTLFLAIFMGFGLAVHDADAKRFGGGSSIGKQRSMTQQTAPQRPAQAPAAAPAPAQSGAGKWLGPLAGLAAGGLLASLFMGHGGGLGNMLMILALVAAVFFIMRMLRRPQPESQPMQYAGLGGQAPEQAVAVPTIGSGLGAPATNPSTRPAWFEDEPFLRDAKKHFIRLQDAYDRGDLNDIREFVNPEMYAEISLQIQERNGKPNKTEVVTLDAAMANVVTEGDLVIASVRFSGMIREEEGQPAHPFDEIWHIQKNQSQANAAWFIAGIQQVA